MWILVLKIIKNSGIFLFFFLVRLLSRLHYWCAGPPYSIVKWLWYFTFTSPYSYAFIEIQHLLEILKSSSYYKRFTKLSFNYFRTISTIFYHITWKFINSTFIKVCFIWSAKSLICSQNCNKYDRDIFQCLDQNEYY